MDWIIRFIRNALLRFVNSKILLIFGMLFTACTWGKPSTFVAIISNNQNEIRDCSPVWSKVLLYHSWSSIQHIFTINSIQLNIFFIYI